MALITVETDCEDTSGEKNPEPRCADTNEGEITLRASNDAAENGYDQDPGSFDWLNSARITLDPNQDAVICSVSVGDPRGAFTFMVRRDESGRILLHTSHPGDSLPHMMLRELHSGTFEVVTEGKGDELNTYHHVRDDEPDDDDDEPDDDDDDDDEEE